MTTTTMKKSHEDSQQKQADSISYVISFLCKYFVRHKFQEFFSFSDVHQL